MPDRGNGHMSSVQWGVRDGAREDRRTRLLIDARPTFLIVFALMELCHQRDEEGDRAGVYEVSALLTKLRPAALQ